MTLRSDKGFTLAEMAIVLVIVGLLLTSVLTTVSTQLQARDLADTQTSLNQIKDALFGFAQTNGRLPCPADGTLAAGATGAGLEEVDPLNNTCKTPISQYAVLPWATLGVQQTDVWGRRFTYRVSSDFSDTISNNTWNCAPVPTPTLSSFALCSLGTLTINTRTSTNKGGGSGTLLAGNVPAVIISHGKNGYGAYNIGGTKIVSPPAANVDETTNANAASTTFISRELSPQTGTCSDTAAGNFCEFDDVLAYIPVNLLVTRMVSAGKLP